MSDSPQDEPFKAIYLPPSGIPAIQTVPHRYTPTGSQSLIRVEYSGINPGDLRHFHMGMNSFIMGYDFTGTVLSTGPSSPYSPGDAVFGMTKPGHARPSHYGAHQAYLLAEPYLLWHRPADLDALSAVRIPSAAQTAADALFNVLGFGFPPIGLDGINPTGKAVLIWGGAGSVGWAAVQLAREAGFGYILVTASKANHGLLKGAGATHVFDYREANVVDDIHAALKGLGVELEAVLDAVGLGLGIFEPPGTEVGEYANSTPAIAKRCLSDDVLKSGRARLCCVLPVLQDPDWEFTLYSRKHDEQQEQEHPGWWQRQEKVVTWLVENHNKAWKPMPTPKVVRDSAEAVAAVEDAFAGRQTVEKVVIEHPML